MLIGELAQRSGVPPKTLRYYEDIGVIEPPDRTTAGYRVYQHSVFERLAFIRSAQALGLSLGEIREVIAMRDDGQVPCAHVLGLLRTRSREVRTTIVQLRLLETQLKELVARAERLDAADCEPGRVCHLIGSE